MKSIDNTICISTMIAASGFVFRIYRRILRKSESRPRADMFTRACPRKEKGKKCKRHVRPLWVRFHPFPVDGARVGHVLVLVFAATRRHLALRASRIIERAVRHVEFFEMRFVKASYTV